MGCPLAPIQQKFPRYLANILGLFNQKFGQELLDLHMKLSCPVGFLVHAWSRCGGFQCITPSMHRQLTEHEKYCMQHNQLRTKTPVGLKDNTIDHFIIINSRISPYRPHKTHRAFSRQLQLKGPRLLIDHAMRFH